MAKANKSGLGRGLNSLLGGAFEEAAPLESTPKRVLVEQQREETVVPIPMHTEPVVERQNVSRETITPMKEESIVDGESQVTIKSVVQRRTDEVPIESVSPNPDQPRTNFKREALEELAASIEKDGLLQPILVRPVGTNEYQIIAGERRWQACKIVGLKTVPVRIKDADDDQALELALVENIQRSDLNPIEEAYGYRRMMERRNLTQSEVAQAMSKGRSTVANALRLLELPEEAQQLLFEEKISAGHARAILSIPTKEGRQKLTDKLVAEKLTVREAEAIARLFSGKRNDAPTKKEPLPKTFKTVAKALKDVLHTPVKVKSSNGKNKIEIEFQDEEDLERLFAVSYTHLLDITGDDLAVLIGRHGKTLDALQFLVSAITVRTIGFRYPVIVDVEGYKSRQREKLESIARSSANRAASQNRSIKLRPMTPYERRIVHICLRDDDRVETASEGEGSARHVVILPR